MLILMQENEVIQLRIQPQEFKPWIHRGHLVEEI